MVIFVTPFIENLCSWQGTPNLRIVPAVAFAAFATISWDKLGPGNGGKPSGPEMTVVPPP